MATAQLQQIRLGSSSPRGFLSIADVDGLKGASYEQDHDELTDALLGFCPAHLWHDGSYSAGCPRPILIDRYHQEQMEVLHEALKNSIVDIVQRWWSDKEAGLPERMPLEKEEEELLKWIDGQVASGNMPKFPEVLGSWRPDFLVEDHTCNQTGSIVENFRITEINARFSFNGFMHEVYGQRALDKSLDAIDGSNLGLVSATDPDAILDGLFSLFRHDVPLHLLKGEEHGIDIFMFVDAVHRRFGSKPRLVTPAELRLVADPQSKSGYRLCCLAKEHTDGDAAPSSAIFTTDKGEVVEEIHQVGLELHQRELVAMGEEMLRQISLRCFNDMRTILLVHDKRMLGVVKQEIPNLLARNVLTPSQAIALDRGVTDTYLPGSREMEEVLQACRASPKLRYEHLLKPIRSGKGAGIVFGDDMKAEEWEATLEKLRNRTVIAGVTCVLQRKINPRAYEIILKSSGDRVQYPLVGTYHVTNGKLLGLGTWRANSGRIVAVSGGGSWICSVIRQE